MKKYPFDSWGGLLLLFGAIGMGYFSRIDESLFEPFLMAGVIGSCVFVSTGLGFIIRNPTYIIPGVATSILMTNKKGHRLHEKGFFAWRGEELTVIPLTNVPVRIVRQKPDVLFTKDMKQVAVVAVVTVRIPNTAEGAFAAVRAFGKDISPMAIQGGVLPLANTMLAAVIGKHSLEEVLTHPYTLKMEIQDNIQVMKMGLVCEGVAFETIRPVDKEEHE